MSRLSVCLKRIKVNCLEKGYFLHTVLMVLSVVVVGLFGDITSFFDPIFFFIEKKIIGIFGNRQINIRLSTQNKITINWYLSQYTVIIR